MENIRGNVLEKDDKRGILKGQQIKDNGETYDEFKGRLSALDKKNFLEILELKDDIIIGLCKEVNRLTMENDNLIQLHNISDLNFSKEIDSEDNPFLANQVEGYDIDEFARAFEEENNIVM